MMIFVYTIIVFLAAVVGSYLGGGSGVIIKPLLTLIVDDPTAVINFISATAVFAMSASSLVKYTHAKAKIDYKTVVLISIGSICGGYVGKKLFDVFINITTDNLAMAIQALMLAIMLGASIVYVNKGKKSFCIKNPFVIVIVGLVLGTISSFLGIGGGPINLMFLVLFFSVSIKDAAVYSVAIMFFSHISKFAAYIISDTIPKFDYRILIAVIPASIVGGIVGAIFNKKSNNATVKKTYTIVLSAFVLMNVYNAVRGFIM